MVAAAEQIDAYFRRDLLEFSLPLDPAGTDFQRRVWFALADISYGATESYGDLAARVGNPKACRAVGMANGRNPIPLVLPCHRVIGADGSLTGYGGGLELKQRLLDHERSVAPATTAAAGRRSGPGPRCAAGRSVPGPSCFAIGRGEDSAMTWAWVYLASSLVGAGLVLNAFRPLRHEYLLVPSFFAGWYTGELPVWHIVWQVAATVVFAVVGAFGSWPGWVGLAVAVAVMGRSRRPGRHRSTGPAVSSSAPRRRSAFPAWRVSSSPAAGATRCGAFRG